MKFCSKCGKEIHEEAVICIHCGCETERKREINTGKNKWITLLLCIFLGGLGGHHFYTENYKKAVIYTLVVIFGWALVIPPIIIGFMCIWDLFLILMGELNGIELSE